MAQDSTDHHAKTPHIHLCRPRQFEQGFRCSVGGMGEGVACGRLYLYSIPQINQCDPAEPAILTEIDDNIVGFDICRLYLAESQAGFGSSLPSHANIPECTLFFWCKVTKPLSTTLVTLLTSSSSRAFPCREYNTSWRLCGKYTNRATGSSGRSLSLITSSNYRNDGWPARCCPRIETSLSKRSERAVLRITSFGDGSILPQQISR